MQEVIAFGDLTAPFRQRVDRFLAKNGVFPNVIMELDSFSAVKMMMKQNLGVTRFPIIKKKIHNFSNLWIGWQKLINAE